MYIAGNKTNSPDSSATGFVVTCLAGYNSGGSARKIQIAQRYQGDTSAHMAVYIRQFVNVWSVWIRVDEPMMRVDRTTVPDNWATIIGRRDGSEYIAISHYSNKLFIKRMNDSTIHTIDFTS